MQIYEVTDPKFKKYGTVVKGVDLKELIETLQNFAIPSDVVYEPSIPELENLSVKGIFENRIYGELPIQIGYCNGHNVMLNAVEYHKNSEINIAADDVVLMLGWQPDIKEDFTYDTSLVEAFRVPKGVAVELYATTLHYAPCHLNPEGFRVAVVLPKGTNYPLTETQKEDPLLFAKNKWLIAHPEGNQGDAYIGLTGKNLNLNE